ncbi:hypothetical protein KIN20_008866 [Parelaphostrongylus tenuis]|uniref:Chondroitin proteoglycan 4 domain-containing protein n=1 Tax=Parelaphostrongylus tenuis TaxID=148309 RepID=A0AAD5M5F2_PARTN|nr:hypothetical protein KIN20_008866 [Parelaphostrongylus tenuis]
MFITLFLYSCLLLTASDAVSNKATSTTNLLTDIISSLFRGPDAINVTRFLSTFQLPTCMRECMPEIDGLAMALSKSNDSSDFVEICSELQSSAYCASSSGCSTILADAATSAFQFVCLDNIQAISESIKCVKNTVLEVQPECEAHCAADSANFENSSSKNDLETFFQTSKLCDSTRCLLRCFKIKIGDKCRLGQRNVLDSLLSVVLQDNDDTDKVLDLILPETCRPKNVPKRISSLPSKSPISVGQVIRRPTSDNKLDGIETADSETRLLTDLLPKTSVDESAGSLEGVLLVDGQIRTLRYQLFDWQGNPVPSPNMEALSTILRSQPILLNISPERSGEAAFPPLEERERKFRELQIKNALEGQKGGEMRHSTDESEAIRVKSTVANETVCISVRFAVFTTTLLLWITKVVQDIY